MNQTIDAVLIWVDSNDSEWQKIRHQYTPDSNTDFRPERYRDMGLLKYWFRGIECFAPWINRVFFVTCGHYPEWLNLSSEKLCFVKHSEYIPEQYLPTFSANPIELNLHRIKGLSERFIYFNDDSFIIQPISMESYFKNGTPQQNASFQPLFYDPSDQVFSHLLLNNMMFINRAFPPVGTRPHTLKHCSLSNGGMKTSIRNFYYSRGNLPGIQYSHLPFPFLKSTFFDAWSFDSAFFDRVCKNRFRSGQDVNQYVMQYWQILSGDYNPVPHALGEYFYLPTSYQNAAKCITTQSTSCVCLNDGSFSSQKEYDSCCKLLTDAFEKILPEKSSFEI